MGTCGYNLLEKESYKDLGCASSMQDPENAVVTKEGSWWNREGMNEVGVDA